MLKVPTAVNSCINEDLQFLEEMVGIKWEGVQGAARGEKLIWEGLQTETAYRLPVPPFANMGQL